jgi:hypothetical protein
MRPCRFRLGFRGFAIFLLLLMAYMGSYYHLSRRGMKEARRYHLAGFLYVPADEVFTTRDLSLHHFRTRLYAPMNWLDQTLFKSSGPVRSITWCFGT